ncbi:MAG: hypothetical protein Q8P41_06225 [Pseudomonadota bacterium]|nr:hypothetical protein [Pseudomonadota bacterium]
MDLALVSLVVIVVARVLDLVALRALSAESQATVAGALLRSRLVSLVAVILALLAGGIAYATTPDVPVQLVIFGILMASIVAQAIIGGVGLVRVAAEGRYTAVFVVSRLVTAAAIGFLIVAP